MSERKRHPWPHEDLAHDFGMAVCGGEWSVPDTRRVGVGEDHVPSITPYEVEEVVRWYVSYHGQAWSEGQNTGTELSLCAVLRLRNGEWASVVASNDFTGWGCQDHSDVRIGSAEDEVVRFGLDVESRGLLGYSSEPVVSDGN